MDETVSALGNETNCTAKREAGRAVTISCSGLMYATNYSLTVRGTANVHVNGTGSLKFAAWLDFSVGQPEEPQDAGG